MHLALVDFSLTFHFLSFLLPPLFSFLFLGVFEGGILSNYECIYPHIRLCTVYKLSIALFLILSFPSRSFKGLVFGHSVKGGILAGREHITHTSELAQQINTELHCTTTRTNKY